MRIWRLSLIAVLLTAAAACHDSKTPKESEPAQKPSPAVVAAPAPASAPTELASIAWTPDQPNQYLQAFDLTVTGVDVLSVCHVPAGWTVQATGAGQGATELKGAAIVGAAFVSRESNNLKDLSNLFLIRTRPGQTLAVTGRATTGVYGPDGDQQDIAASPALLGRRPASQCPPPEG